MAVIVFALFSTFRTSANLSLKMEKAKKVVLERQFCYQRLVNIFSQIDPETLQINDEGLTFRFKNELDREFCYSGVVSAKLFLEKEGDFIVEIVATDQKKPSRTERLYKNVVEAKWNLHENVLTLLIHETKQESPFLFSFFLPSDKEIQLS